MFKLSKLFRRIFKGKQRKQSLPSPAITKNSNAFPTLYQNGEFNPPPAPFSDFPSDVLKWMKKNATSRQTYKLMNICKYFCHKNFPFFIADYLSCEENTLFFLNDLGINDFEELPNNLWLTNEFRATEGTDIGEVIPKIAVCDIRSLFFIYQLITFNELKFLTANGNVKSFVAAASTKIVNDKRKPVFLEDILECLPKVEEIEFETQIPSFSSSKSTDNIVLHKLKNFELANIMEEFNLDAFFDFAFKHQHAHFDIVIQGFVNNQFQKTLQYYDNKIIALWSLEYEFPNIVFPAKNWGYSFDATDFHLQTNN